MCGGGGLVAAKPQKHTPGRLRAQVTTVRFHLSGSRNLRNGASKIKVGGQGYRRSAVIGGVVELGANVVQIWRFMVNRRGVKGGSFIGSLKFKS